MDIRDTLDIMALGTLRKKTIKGEFHKFNPPVSKSPSKKKLGKSRIIKSGSGTFTYSKLGLSYTDNRGLEYEVSSDIPYALARYYIHSIGGETVSEIEWGMHGTALTRLRSTMSNLESDKYLLNHIPHETIINKTRLFSDFIRLNSKGVPLIDLYNYVGFVEGKYDYVHSGGIISNKNTNNVRSELPDGSNMTLDITDASKQNIINLINDLFDLHPVISLLLSFNLLSFTCSKYGIDKPRFVLTLYGESGTFKTTLCLFIFCIYTEFYHNPPVNVKISTLPAIHHMQQRFRDCVCLYDDVAPSSDGNDDMVRICESITRAVGDDTGRTVMGSTKSIHNTKPAGLSAITAEFLPLKNKSDLSRAVIYELKRGSINTKKLTCIQKRKGIYVSMIADYIGWICTLGDEYMSDLMKFFHKGRKKYFKLGKIHGRVCDNFAWLYAGFKMFIKFADKQYHLDKADIDKWHKTFYKAVKHAIKAQKEAMTERDDAALFIQTMNSMLRNNQIELAEVVLGENNKKEAKTSKSIAGYYDERYVYILPDIAYARSNQWLRTFDSGYSLPLPALQSKLITDGYAIASEKGRQKSKLTINGERIQVLKCKRKHFNI